MKRYTLILITFFCYTVASALQPTVWNARYQQYIDNYKDIAIAQMLQYRIPASITLAQGLLESGAGSSQLTKTSNNHFGIKCHGWTGRTAYADDDAAQECFRAYDNAMDSYDDHSKFLTSSPRYRKLFSLSLYDYKGWAQGLKSAGYATNPNYAPLLIGIIECYHLDQYDHATTYDMTMIGNNANRPVSRHHHAQMTGHIVKMCNKRYYVIAKNGDTFASLAKEFDSSARKLARYNERDKKDVLKDGDIVFLQKKRSSAEKQFKHRPHIVRNGESLYDIAQMYGVRLKKLIKKNHMDGNLSVKVGDKIIVY